MKNRMSDLRNHLFETIEQLKDKDTPLEVSRAKAISEVAQTIIESAKVEISFIEAIGASSGSEFFGGVQRDDAAGLCPAVGSPGPRVLTARVR